MHVNGCISSNLSDVFPSLPFSDPVANTTMNGPLLNANGLNVNSNMDSMSRLKYLGFNSSGTGHSSTNSSLFFNEDRSRTNLIINYLPQSYDQNDLQRLFERVGPIRQCKLIRDKNTGASLCYGFVDFVNPQHAALAIQTYHGYETEQKRLRVAYASSGGRRFAPAHRVTAFTNGSYPASINAEVTNENIIGWEIFVVGIPLEWTEPDLLRLFSHFGAVILIRILAPQLSDSPPGQKPRLSPTLNGASSDMSSESIDSAKLTTCASIIFEDKASAEISVLRLNNYQSSDWSSPLRLRIIGSVTRETYGLFCCPSRQSPTLGVSRSNGHMCDPLTESDVLSNMLNRRALNTPNCVGTGNNQGLFMTTDSTKNSDLSVPATVDGSMAIQLHGNPAFNIPPRPIIRNKVGDSNPASVLSRDMPHNNPLDLLDFLDNHTSLSGTNSNLLNSTDRFSIRDNSLLSALTAQRVADQDQTKLDQSIRSLGNTHTTSPWSFPHRSVLNSLPDSGRTSDLQNSLTPGGNKRLYVKSPLILSSMLTNLLSQKGCQTNVWLKLENVQPTGSFKIRGVENACRKWAYTGVHHIVCPTNGNAGIAAAFAAQSFGLSCTLVVPDVHEAMIKKRIVLEALDAKVLAGGTNLLEVHHRAEQLVNDLQSSHSDSIVRLLHPYDQPELWEGYETLIDELNPEFGQPDAIVVAVGGGGLLAGVIQGLWNRGWSSTHVIAVETEGADCLNRSLKSGQLVVIPRSSTIATSLIAPVIAHRTLNLAQCHSISPVTCTDSDAMEATRHFLDDHGMLVEPACGAALSTVYSGYIARLQLEGRIPRPANVVIIVGGGRNVSLRQLIDWENQMNSFSPEQMAAAVLPPLSSSFLSRLSPHSMCTDISKNSTFVRSNPTEIEDSKLEQSSPSTPRPTCTILSRTPVSRSEAVDIQAPIHNTECEMDANSECIGALNPHDLVNFSKLLASNEGEAEESTHK